VSEGESENLVAAISDRVREALLEAEQRGNEFVAEAERRAGEIVAEAQARAERIIDDAEGKAERTIELAEVQARERVERARKALDDLGVALGSEKPAAEPEPEGAGSDPMPEEAPEPAADAGSDPSDIAEEEPEPAPEPETVAADKPSTDELIAQLRGGAEAKPAPQNKGGDAAARLVAMNMALDGASRDEVDKHLAEGYEVADRQALLDEVFSRVSG